MEKRFELLPEEMKSALVGLHELYGIPESMAIQVVLGVATLATQSHFNVNPKLWGGQYGIPISGFFLNITPSGGRKTTIYNTAVESIQEFIKQQEPKLKLDRQVYQRDLKKYQQDLKQWEKDSLTDQMLVPPREPRLPETYDVLLESATRNGIVERLRSQGSVGLFSSEAGEFFSSHAFQGGKDMSRSTELATSLTKMWDGGDVSRQTGVQENNITLKGRRVSMLFLLQDATVQTFLNNTLFTDQGFVPRMLITQGEDYDAPPTEKGHLGEINRIKSMRKIKDFSGVIYNLMRRPCKYLYDDDFRLAPSIIEFENQTVVDSFIDYCNAAAMRKRSDLKDHLAFSNRIQEHVIRLAGMLAGFDYQARTPHGADVPVIKAETLQCAIELMEYYIEQRLKISVGAPVDEAEHTSTVRKVLLWLEAKALTEGGKCDFTKGSIARYGPNFFRKMGVKQRRKILEDLVEDEILTVVLDSKGDITYHFKVENRG